MMARVQIREPEELEGTFSEKFSRGLTGKNPQSAYVVMDSHFTLTGAQRVAAALSLFNSCAARGQTTPAAPSSLTATLRAKDAAEVLVVKFSRTTNVPIVLFENPEAASLYNGFIRSIAPTNGYVVARQATAATTLLQFLSGRPPYQEISDVTVRRISDAISDECARAASRG
jgi:hypothetical protein